MFRAAVVLLCAVLSAGLLAGPADARPRGDTEDFRGDTEDFRGDTEGARDARPERRNDGAGDAARRAQMRNGGGRVLSVEPIGTAYRVKVLKDGVVRVYVIEGN